MRLVLASMAVVVAAAVATAGENLEIRAAQMELKLAQRHLQAAARTHGGHRRAALEQTNLALYEVTQAIKKAREEDGVGKPPRTPPAEGED
jgi:hypothetical protein